MTTALAEFSTGNLPGVEGFVWPEGQWETSCGDTSIRISAPRRGVRLRLTLGQRSNSQRLVLAPDEGIALGGLATSGSAAKRPAYAFPVTGTGGSLPRTGSTVIYRCTTTS